LPGQRRGVSRHIDTLSSHLYVNRVSQIPTPPPHVEFPEGVIRTQARPHFVPSLRRSTRGYSKSSVYNRPGVSAIPYVGARSIFVRFVSHWSRPTLHTKRVLQRPPESNAPYLLPLNSYIISIIITRPRTKPVSLGGRPLVGWSGASLRRPCPRIKLYGYRSNLPPYVLFGFRTFRWKKIHRKILRKKRPLHNTFSTLKKKR